MNNEAYVGAAGDKQPRESGNRQPALDHPYPGGLRKSLRSVTHELEMQRSLHRYRTKLEMSQPQKTKKLEFPERVLLLRNRMKLNQVQFGEKLGVSDEYVSQIEKGKRDPGETLKLLVAELEGKFQLGPAADSNSGSVLHESSPEYHTPPDDEEDWRHRALLAEKEVLKLKRAMQQLIATDSIKFDETPAPKPQPFSPPDPRK